MMNLTTADLYYMEKDVSEHTKRMARQIPYHLQYLREGKPYIKPKEDKTNDKG